jgi:TadE-like protein
MGTIRRMRFKRTKRVGQAQIEFLLSVLFLLIVVVGVVEIIILMYTYTVLAGAAKEGVRYATVHGCNLTGGCSGDCTPKTTCPDPSADNVKAYVRNFLRASLHDSSPAVMPVTVTYLDSKSNTANRVRVTVSYGYQPLFGLGWPTVTVRAAAEGRIFY